MRFVWLAVLGFCSLALGQVEKYPDSAGLKRLNQALTSGDDAAKKAAAEAWIKERDSWQGYIEKLDGLDYRRRSQADPDDPPVWPSYRPYREILEKAGEGINALTLKNNELGNSLLRTIARELGSLNFSLYLGNPGGCMVMGEMGLLDMMEETLGKVAKTSPERLAPLLQDPDARVVQAAAKYLVWYVKPNTEALATLAKRVDDPKKEVRCVVAQYLLAAPLGQYEAEIRTFLASSDPQMVAVLANHLGIPRIKALYPDATWHQLPPAAKIAVMMNPTKDFSHDPKRVAMGDLNPEVAAVAYFLLDSKVQDVPYNPRWLDSKLAAVEAAEKYLWNTAKRDPETWFAMLKRDKRLMNYQDLQLLHQVPAETAAAAMMELIPMLETSDRSTTAPYFMTQDWQVFEPVAMRMMRSKSAKVRYSILSVLEYSDKAGSYLPQFVNDPDPMIRGLLMHSSKPEVVRLALSLAPQELKSKDRERVFGTMDKIADYGMETHFGDLKAMAASPDKQFAEYARALLASR